VLFFKLVPFFVPNEPGVVEEGIEDNRSVPWRKVFQHPAKQFFGRMAWILKHHPYASDGTQKLII
jgi:hypothetical protein